MSPPLKIPALENLKDVTRHDPVDLEAVKNQEPDVSGILTMDENIINREKCKKAPSTTSHLQLSPLNFQKW